MSEAKRKRYWGRLQGEGHLGFATVEVPLVASPTHRTHHKHETRVRLQLEPPVGRSMHDGVPVAYPDVRQRVAVGVGDLSVHDLRSLSMGLEPDQIRWELTSFSASSRRSVAPLTRIVSTL